MAATSVGDDVAPPGEGPEGLSFTLEMGHTDCQKVFFNGGLVGW